MSELSQAVGLVVVGLVGHALLSEEGAVVGGASSGGSVSGVAGGSAPVVVQNKVLAAVQQAIDQGLIGADCWDWAFQVYRLAGYGGEGKTLQGINVLFRGQQYDSASPDLYLPASRYGEISPGDWLYVHNANQFDRVGNHSDIFISWVNQSTGEATTASSPGVGLAGRYRERNLTTNPIAWWMRGAV